MSTEDIINQRLASLGSYHGGRGKYPELRWTKPTGVPSAFRPFELIFDPAMESPDRSTYAQLLDELDRLAQNADALIRDAGQCAIEVFREVYADQMTSQELARYQDDHGNLSDELILAAIKPNAIVLTASDEGVAIDFSFYSKWDDEHGLELELEGDSFSRPWRDGY